MNQLNQLLNYLRQQAQRLHNRVRQLLHKEQTVENNNTPVMYTEEQLMARLKFFIGICLSLTLFGIVFVVLYSLIFVTQPLNAISPIDQKFFELIVPIATFLTGTLSGIMLAGNNPEAQQKALEAANKGWDKPPAPIATTPSTPSMGGLGGFSMGGVGAAPAFGATPTPSFGNNVSTGFGAPTGFNQPIAMTASGKKIVPEEPQPEL
jgi:hypothetical protein